MSAIDCMDHAHVGNFFNLPIYWPLEERPLSDLTDATQDQDITINQYFLSIGGGSGEHAALIINNDAVVFQLIKYIANTDNQFDNETFNLANQIQKKYLTQDLFFWNLDQNQWSLESFINIHKKMNRLNRHSPYSLQERIQHSLAMFIIYEMPIKNCLSEPDLLEFAQLIRSNKCIDIFDSIKNEFMSCKLIKSGAMGRIIKNDNVVWGYSLEEWSKDNQSAELADKLSSTLPEKHKALKIKL